MTYLYWIYDDTCNNPKEDGYIGITTILKEDLNNIY